MTILILNSILFTADNNIIPKVSSIKDTMIYNMCLGFKELGHNSMLAASEAYKPCVAEKYDFEVSFFKSNFKKIFLPSVLPFSWNLKKYLKKNQQKFDFVISSEAFSFSSLFAALICPEKTIIWHELAIHPSKFHRLPSKLWYNFICRFFMQNVSLIIPRSEKAKKFIKLYFKNVSELCIEHGININQFGYSVEKKRQFICVGQLIARKNVGGIIKIFSNFIKKYKFSYVLVIAGHGELEQDLRNYADALNVGQYVKFIGFLNHENLNKILRQSQGMLIDTYQDNNMVSIPESIVSGTPVLTNSIPTNSYLIKNNALGIVKDNWNEDDLFELVKKNLVYIENCIQYRAKLTSQYSAKLFVDVWASTEKLARTNLELEEEKETHYTDL